MAVLSDAQQQIIARFPLGCVGTVSPKGAPMVSPKGTFLVLDPGRIAFGNIRSPQTVSNLRHAPACEVVFVDPFARKGVRVAGKADILTQADAGHMALFPRWRDTWGDLAERISALVVITITEVGDVTTPPYDDGVSEMDMVAIYKAKYAEYYP